MYLQNHLEYRGDLFVYSMSNLITPLVGLGLWMSVSGSGGFVEYTSEEIMAYFLLIIWINSFTVAWTSYFISEDIQRGNFSKFLVKPMSAFSDRLLLVLAEKVYKQIFVTVVILALFYFFFPGSFGEFHITILTFFLFTLGLAMSFLIAFLIDFTIGMSAVWFHDISFAKNYYGLVDDLLSGKVVPLSFLPVSLAGVVSVLPFRYTLSFPAEILLDKLNAHELVFGFGMQIFWVVLAYALYKVVGGFALKYYQGYGS